MVGALLVFLPRLGTPPRFVWDEILHAYTAREYLQGNADAYRWDIPCAVARNDGECLAVNPDAALGTRVGKYEWTHPPLGKELIAGGIAVFGDTAFGRRIAGAGFGAIGVAVSYWLALTLTRRRPVAVLAAGLLMVDGLYFVQARIATLDTFATVFVMAALLAFARVLEAPPDRVARPLLVSGALFGLGIATKWSAAYAAVLVGGVVLWRAGRLWWEGRRGGTRAGLARAGFRAHLLWAPIAFGVVPVAIYLLAHLPHFLHGFGFADLLDLQRAMLDYHRTYRPAFEDASAWWQWPLAWQPVWYGGTEHADGRVSTLLAFGNPLLCWAFVPAALWLVWRWGRARQPLLAVFAIGFFGQWLPWALVPRPAFAYHFLPVVPFGALAVAAAVGALWRSDAGWRRTLAVEYVAMTVAAFAFFYPLYAYLPLGEWGLGLRHWLPGWR